MNVIVLAGAAALLAFFFFRDGKPIAIGTAVVVRSRDGAQHQLKFATIGAGSGFVAQSSDTSNRFQQGETLKILGRDYTWQAGLNAFVEA